jgi:uncharacterized DUF497 family protein
MAMCSTRQVKIAFIIIATSERERLLVNGDVLHSTSEDRFIIIATSERERLLAVAFTYRDDETIRIISARRANRREQEIYEQEKRSD